MEQFLISCYNNDPQPGSKKAPWINDLDLCLVTFDVGVIQAIECWNEIIWLVSDEGGRWDADAGAALCGLEACCLPSWPGGPRHFGCYLQVRKKPIHNHYVCVAENWWTLLYLYGDAAFHYCVSKSRQLGRISSKCFFDILTWFFRAWSIIKFLTRQVKQSVVIGALLEELGPIGKYSKES